MLGQIRRDRDDAGLSARALAARHHLHRLTVKQALGVGGSAGEAPKLGECRELIDDWLIADPLAPRKERHMPKWIWRLVDEHGVEVAETRVRDYARKRHWELGLTVGEVFVLQVRAPGRRTRSTGFRRTSTSPAPGGACTCS